MPQLEYPPVPPKHVSPIPDEATRRRKPDYTTRTDADDRVLFINLRFFRYGTNDKAHAAALVLSLILLLTIIALIFVGPRHAEGQWDDKAFSWLGGAFLFIAGVALGGSRVAPRAHESED